VVGVGDVRLANRARLLAESRSDAQAPTDLELVIDRYLDRGPAAVRDLIGDFSFVLWDLERRTAFAARDALGVKPLFYQRCGDRLTVASSIGCLEPADYDRDFLGFFLAGLPSGTTRTAFRDVVRLAPGTALTVKDGRLETTRWWSAAEFAAAPERISEADAVVRFRQLFEEAVLAQLDEGVDTWAQLSGGLDSSANVAMASTLAAAGRVDPLGGTLTIVDSLGAGDETRFSNAVVERYRIRNERIADYWAWQRDEHGFPNLSEPHPFLPFSARDREACRTVRENGAKVLLSGFGSDNYLAFPPIYLADLVARRQWREAAHHLTDLAIAERRSFWKLGFDYGIRPLLPRAFQRRWADPLALLPSWIDRDSAEDHDLTNRILRLDLPRTGAGVFADQMVAEIESIDLAFEPATCRDGIEIRYPFLYRPLVEFCLRLPPVIRSRPGTTKWVQRQALGDLLPDVVRRRRGKGGIDARIFWSLNQEQMALTRLIARSHLADLGWVDRAELRRSFDRTMAGDAGSVAPLFITLALETWLAVRVGSWSGGSPLNRLSGSPAGHARKERHDETAVR
jgi:asparagine synthase (glutamine-hydrolysing)